MWNCSVHLLRMIVIFEPGIAFPCQTLAWGSLDVKMNCVAQIDIQLSLFVALGFGVSSFSLAGVSCLRGSDSCVRPSKRLKLTLVLWSRRRNFVLGIWGSNFRAWVWSRKLDFITRRHRENAWMLGLFPTSLWGSCFSLGSRRSCSRSRCAASSHNSSHHNSSL